MFNLSKRKKYISLILISIILILISIIFIHINFNNQVFQNKLGLVHFSLSVKNPIKDLKLANLECAPKIVDNIYKSHNWRIIISKINLNAPILEGTTSEILRKGVGHFENTEKYNGNICLAAHNRGYKYNFFQEIKKLEIGDKIKYIIDGEELDFEVTDNKTIDETDISVLENTYETKLTLITCEENKKEYRRCVQAERIL